MSRARIKICGITQVADARLAADAGADAIGIVFYPPSLRHVADLALARDIAQAAGPLVTVVGLFVDPEPPQLDQVLQQVPLNLLQFHGNESPASCDAWQRPYIKALRMKPDANIAEQAAAYSRARGILLDAYRPGIPGGTGETFDWARIPPLHQPLLLAGGLGPANVAAAIKQVQPWAVDVSGGVEAEPGIKCEQRVRAFISNARQTDTTLN